MGKKTAATLALCLSMSVASFGQNQVIHLPQAKASVSAIIKAIEKQTQMSVDFSQNAVNLNKTVSLKSKSLTLGEIMDQILGGSLTYKIVDRTSSLSSMTTTDKACATHSRVRANTR